MRRGALAAVVASSVALLLAPGAAASHDPSGEPFGEDFVVGSFTTTALTLVVQFTIDAHSGPSGGNPTGEVSVNLDGDVVTSPVVCLNVTGSRATIGVDFPQGIGGGWFFVEDNDGAGEDVFSAAPTATGEPPSVCPPDSSTPSSPISSGDITVHDAPARPTAKDQCKNGGWRNFPGFKNQGQCVAFVQRGPKP